MVFTGHTYTQGNEIIQCVHQGAETLGALEFVCHNEEIKTNQ